MNDVSLSFLLKILKQVWWIVLSITLVVMIIVACLTHFFVPKKYSSSIEFYVININSGVDYTTTSYLGASAYLINDYVSIIKSNYMLDKICLDLKEDGFSDISPDTIRGMISSSSSDQSSVFKLSVSHTDKELAYKIASYIAEFAPDYVTKMARPATDPNELPTKCVEVLTPPVEDKVADSPNLPLYTLGGGVLAAIVVYVCFLVRSIIAATIVTEEDLRKISELPLLGVIPRWDSKALRSQEKGE